jgi:hypothetical protein
MIKEKTEQLFDCRFIVDYEITDIARAVSNFRSEWSIDTSRQDYGNSQRETSCFWLVDIEPPKNSNSRKDSRIALKNESNLITKQLFSIIESLEVISNGKVGKALLARLTPHSQVYPHKDRGLLFECSRRFHIPITTNDQSYITVGATKLNMRQGECWEINNCATHSAQNLGKTDRVHLIVDIILNEYM